MVRLGLLLALLGACGASPGVYYLECLDRGVARVYGPSDGMPVTELPFCDSDIARESPGLEACQLALRAALTCPGKSGIVEVVP